MTAIAELLAIVDAHADHDCDVFNAARDALIFAPDDSIDADAWNTHDVELFTLESLASDAVLAEGWSEREELTAALLGFSLCPVHRCDYASCFDDDNPECAAVRVVHPAHDS